MTVNLEAAMTALDRCGCFYLFAANLSRGTQLVKNIWVSPHIPTDPLILMAHPCISHELLSKVMYLPWSLIGAAT